MFKSHRLESNQGAQIVLRCEADTGSSVGSGPFIEENDTSCFVYPFDCLDCDRLWRAGTGSSCSTRLTVLAVTLATVPAGGLALHISS